MVGVTAKVSKESIRRELIRAHGQQPTILCHEKDGIELE